jgi:hypothetical protein
VSLPEFEWDDLSALGSQLTEEERLIRKTARDYAQGKLVPRVRDAFRHAKTDPAVFREMGELGLLGCTVSPDFGGAGSDRARGRARRFRISVDDTLPSVTGARPSHTPLFRGSLWTVSISAIYRLMQRQPSIRRTGRRLRRGPFYRPWVIVEHVRPATFFTEARGARILVAGPLSRRVERRSAKLERRRTSLILEASSRSSESAAITIA